MTIELTSGQKLQIAVILITLGLASYFIFNNKQPVFDTAINSWFDLRKFPIAANRPYDKDKNPYDPKKEESVTIFGCADGKIEFIEWRNDPSRALDVNFIPDKRQAGKIFQYYFDPLSLLAKIKDPFHHAMSYAIYYKLYDGRTASLLGQLQPPLTTDQLAKEKELRATMEASLAALDSDKKNGTFRKDMVDKLNKALHDFQANKADIRADANKREQARQLLTLASTFQRAFYERRGIDIDKYVTGMEAVMTEEQQNKLIDLVSLREHPSATPPSAAGGRRGGLRGAATRGRAGATLPNRGAATFPGRGAGAGFNNGAPGVQPNNIATPATQIAH